MQKWNDIKAKRMAVERQTKLDAEVKLELIHLELAELRAMAGLTQNDLAALTEQTQSQLSRLESRDDHRVSTLRKYVEALGGKLEVVAVVGNKRVTLQGV